MLYIKEFNDGDKITGIYYCKSKINAVTKNGKNYGNLVISDKTGSVDAKVWEPNSAAIGEYEAGDYIDIFGDVSVYNGAKQVSIKRLRKADETEYSLKDYVPHSRYSVEEMYKALMAYIDKVEDPYLKKLINRFFVEDQTFIDKFKASSAAKSIHHGFAGGLLEHTFGVVRLCHYYSRVYPYLNADILITSALFHDIGKIVELSPFPANDYTDDGQLLGHIAIGTEMIHDAIKEIEGFPPELESKLKHCILSHHGELEFGSPKKPATAEALALSLADLTDARIETMRELTADPPKGVTWLGYSKVLETNIRISE